MKRPFLSVVMGLILMGSQFSAALADDADVNFKIYSPTAESKSADAPAGTQEAAAAASEVPTDTAPTGNPSTEATSSTESAGGDAATKAEGGAVDGQQIASRVLQGYIRVVPSGTKIPIIMDTAVDTDTSQEGDEFSARTGEDLSIDGTTVVPAGSVIKGRIAQLNAPKRLDRSGSVAFKFDTVTTPDNRQIPIVANLVARGGVVHAKRGMKDLALETGMVSLPTLAGLGIGLLAGGGDNSKVSRGGGAVIGASIGAAVGVVILLSKKGKKVDVRPGDELKIELAEDLRMPM